MGSKKSKKIGVSLCGAEVDFYAVHFLFGSIPASQPIADVLCPQSHRVGRELLGMSSPALREVSNYKNQVLHRRQSKLDVLTPLSDCRQESVEKMERRI